MLRAIVFPTFFSASLLLMQGACGQESAKADLAKFVRGFQDGLFSDREIARYIAVGTCESDQTTDEYDSVQKSQFAHAR